MIIVTGAGGTVGSEVVRQLQSAKAPFRAAYFSQKKTEAALARGIDAVTIDYNRPHTIVAAFRGTDKLFLLAPSVLNQTDMELNAVDAAKTGGVKHIVKQSVWKADGEGYTFAKIHRTAEQAIESSGMAWTFLRPNGFMQNIENYMSDTIKASGEFYSAVGNTKMSHIDARDIAAAAVEVLTKAGHEGKAYLLSGPEALSYNDMAVELTKVLKRPIRHVNLSLSDLKSGMLSMNIPEPYANWLVDLDRYYGEGHAGSITNDIRTITGRDPIRFEQHARDYADRLQKAA